MNYYNYDHYKEYEASVSHVTGPQTIVQRVNSRGRWCQIYLYTGVKLLRGPGYYPN